jgi:hypothetical protein
VSKELSKGLLSPQGVVCEAAESKGLRKGWSKGKGLLSKGIGREEQG